MGPSRQAPSHEPTKLRGHQRLNRSPHDSCDKRICRDFPQDRLASRSGTPIANVEREMLRVTELQTPQGTTLRVEGRVTGPWVDELRRAVAAVIATHRVLTIDLAEMSFLDLRGVSLLRELESRSVILVNLSPFVAEQFKGLERD